MYIFRLLICLLVILLHLNSMGLTVEASSPVNILSSLIKQKEQAVNQHDWSRYVSILHPDHPYYIQEQKRWFFDTIQYIDPGSYQINLLSVISQSDQQIDVWVQQSYKRNGKLFTIKYPLRFVKTHLGFKDADLAFHQIQSDSIVVRFSDSKLKEQGKLALDTLKKAIFLLSSKYHWRPKRIEVKLYHHPEIFRQSVKPSLPKWAIGWHEADQAIKFVAEGMDKKELAFGLIHELVHQMVSEITNDNASYWLQEGAATYYEKNLLSKPMSGKIIRTPLIGLDRLEKIRLEKLPMHQAHLYYQSCYHLFDFMVQEYGEKQMRRFFTFLGKFPKLDCESSEKIKTTNWRTRKGIDHVWGISVEELSKKWLNHS
ncbi:peptidase MA family metallohydrolase [Thermoflavimicrobium daqui]|uniref:Peptidase MA-like domain-containing protein n=1 Tax=Thermoflavimicrobium daqui TaxID=2137476 RepID=A0A364K1V3_9BACL|nr:hypothetical protein [Thermoflavimicrobium daqui]RAL22012.1 hypothetical protein DL897_14460 [Thermoflavimicrobium daqui]